MTPSAGGYSVDTSIIIDLRVRYYPPDVFPGLWQNIEDLIDAGRMIVADEVSTELQRGDDDCHDWVKGAPGLIAPSDGEVLGVVAKVATDFEDWSSEQANWADPYVIGHAHSRGWTVVTSEKMSLSPLPGRTKIPNVCQHLAVPCMTLLEWARAEGWTFR